MDKLDNYRLVVNAGDHLQFEYGNNFGFFTKQIDKKTLYKFCERFNYDEYAQNKGFVLGLKNSKNDLYVVLTNSNKNLYLSVRLLDHTVFIQANESEWSKIPSKVYFTIQKHWRNFLADNIKEYENHLFKTTALEPAESATV